MATQSSILAWRVPMDRGPWWATVHGGHKELDMTEATHTHTRAHTHTLDSEGLYITDID